MYCQLLNKPVQASNRYTAANSEAYIIIIIIERKDLGGVMPKNCKDTIQTLKTMTRRNCDAKELIE